MTAKQETSLPELGKGDALIDKAMVTSLLPRRAIGAHKWEVGGLIVIGGAPGYIGAPALSAMAAGRVGAGIVLLAVPRGIAGAIASLVPEAAYIPLPDGDPGSSGRRSREAIGERLERANAVLVGPGLTTDDYASALLAELFGVAKASGAGMLGFGHSVSIQSTEKSPNRLLGAAKPAVIDADGLNWLATQERWWDGLEPQTLVLTPHPGEMSRLLDCPVEEVVSDPIGAARAAAVRWRQIVVLKTSHAIATDGKKAYVAADAPPSLATAGTGDVLAGAIGGLLAQGVAPLDAAVVALYVGAEAARKVEERVGTLGLVASDLPLAMAETLRDLETK